MISVVWQWWNSLSEFERVIFIISVIVIISIFGSLNFFCNYVIKKDDGKGE